MIVQLYSDGLLRAFKDRNSSSIFEVQNVTYRELDLLGLPRLGKPRGKPWERCSWGWEIEVNFKCALTKRAADSLKAGEIPASRFSSKSKVIRPAISG